MINFILMLIGFLSPNSTTTIPQIQSATNTAVNLKDTNGGPVGGNTGQTPPPFIQP